MPLRWPHEYFALPPSQTYILLMILFVFGGVQLICYGVFAFVWYLGSCALGLALGLILRRLR